MKKWMRNYGVPACIILAVLLVILTDRGVFRWGQAEEKEGMMSSGQESSGEEISYGMDIPYEYQADINERNRIDAMVDVPDAIRGEGFRKASGRMADVPEASILALLEEDYHPYIGEESDVIKQYLGEDELHLTFSKEYPEFTVYCRTAGYIGDAFRDQPTEDCNRERYALDVELPGFPLSDCDRRIEDLFRSYGVGCELRIVHSTLDHETMEKEALELMEDGTWKKPDYHWDTADDSYSCRVWQLCNGIPMIPWYLVQAYGDILYQGSHTLVLNRERVVRVNMTEVYDIQYGQGYERLLGFDEVLGRYGQITERTPENCTIEVTDIALRVTEVDEGGGKYRMAPIWIFYGTKIYKDGAPLPFAVIMDAVTGDEL